ncbi:MAG: pentapeptide repeat-containing protein [Cyanobacteria bacterium P01_H01_bin.26]
MVAAINYLELIEQGVDAWNSWRLEHPDECPELESAYLFEQSLQGINFRRANLSRACLIGANLEGADLSDANLSGVYANNAHFHGANLAAADLQEGNFIEADLSQADLSDAVIEGANFTNARLQGTCLDGWPNVAATQTPDRPQVAPAQVAPAVQVPPAANSKSLPRLPLILGAIALAAGLIYLALRPRAPKFVTADGTITIDLVCNEPEELPTLAEPDHIYQTGTEFYGAFGDGKPGDGRGTMVYPNGNRYHGEYRDGQRSGCGTFVFDNGRRYVGQFSNDLFSGRGVWQLENGDRYIGDFEFNKCNGEGVYIFADGTSESGIWQQGRLVGGDLTCDRTPLDLPDS